MARKGKYRTWIEPNGLTLIEGWARSGLSDEQIAHNIGIHPATLYKWINEYNEISEAIKKGKEVADYEIENAMYKAALGYEFEEVKTYVEDAGNGQKKRVEKIKKHVAPNVTAQIFWLKNRKPEAWRDKQDIEHSGNVDVGKKSDIILKYLDGDSDDSE